MRALDELVLVREPGLDLEFSESLGAQVSVVLAPLPDPRGCERSFGRVVLERVCGEAGFDLPAGWPHPRVSLSHTRALVAVVLAHDAPLGVGVDVEEEGRCIDPRAARFFLTPREESLVPDLLTAWTLKEAVFKADPLNADRHLACYEMVDPEASTGWARVLPTGPLIRYTSTTTHGLRLSVALTSTREGLL